MIGRGPASFDLRNLFKGRRAKPKQEVEQTDKPRLVPVHQRPPPTSTGKEPK